MRAYELMVILDPNLEERIVQPSLDTYLNVVRNDGGSVDNVDVWGRRRLAYEIDKVAEGIYAPGGTLEAAVSGSGPCGGPRFCQGLSSLAPYRPRVRRVDSKGSVWG